MTETDPSSPSEGNYLLPGKLLEAEQLKEKLDTEAFGITQTVALAKVRGAALGQYSDPNWFHRVQTKLKHLNRHRQVLQVHIARLRKNLRVQEADELNRELLNALRSRVPAELFQECVEAAKQAIKNKSN
ncbi:hypothetical protein [Pseudomonas aeruginosa]|uniref:hypothetical protein n=1 Tax=Pseudomonas aeruginosa TaxID=287 RepID=UPI0013CDF3AC|nr:hypothetical protein [Pseudomonas aeruginosa]